MPQPLSTSLFHFTVGSIRFWFRLIFLTSGLAKLTKGNLPQLITPARSGQGTGHLWTGYVAIGQQRQSTKVPPAQAEKLTSDYG